MAFSQWATNLRTEARPTNCCSVSWCLSICPHHSLLLLDCSVQTNANNDVFCVLCTWNSCYNSRRVTRGTPVTWVLSLYSCGRLYKLGSVMSPWWLCHCHVFISACGRCHRWTTLWLVGGSRVARNTVGVAVSFVTSAFVSNGILVLLTWMLGKHRIMLCCVMLHCCKY